MNYKINDKTLTIFFVGELNSSNSEDVEKEIDGITSSVSFDSILLDFEKLNYISSAGLRVVLRLKKLFDDTSIINVNGDVYKTLEIVNFSELLTVKRLDK